MKKSTIITTLILLLVAGTAQAASVFDYSGGNQAQNQMSSPFLRFEFDKPVDKSAGSAKNSYNWNRYMKNLQHKLNSQILVKRNSPIAVSFVTAKDGTVSDVEIITSSGNTEFDKYVKTSIEAAAPFASLPSKYKGNKIKVKLDIYNGAMNTSVTELE